MIKMLIDLFMIAMVSIFAENVVFTGGFSSCQLIRATKRPTQILFFGGVVTVFELLAVTVIYPIDLLLGVEDWARYVRFALFPVVVSVIYVVTVLILKAVNPKLFNLFRKTLIKAAFNCVVLGVPFIISLNKSSVATAAFGNFGYVLFYALGAGLGFMVASWLIYEALDKLQSPEVPKAFSGLPALLIYIGILSLAFFGFGGRPLY